MTIRNDIFSCISVSKARYCALFIGHRYLELFKVINAVKMEQLARNLLLDNQKVLGLFSFCSKCPFSRDFGQSRVVSVLGRSGLGRFCLVDTFR